MKYGKPFLICLTPVKNEAWILDRFLKCASLWADYIIIADQQSMDGSIEIAKKYPKVIAIDNNEKKFSEKVRQNLLINEARKIKGPKILITLDADEILTGDSLNSGEWKLILNSEPGTVIRFRFLNIYPDFKYYWWPQYYMSWGFVDDGRMHEGIDIHSSRLPVSGSTREIFLEEIKVMHFQYTNWERMESKHRWYQCYERINNPDKSSIEIFRPYHHMYAIKKSEVKKIPDEWFDYYKQSGIDLAIANRQKYYYWEKLVLEFFDKYGTKFFKKEDIWDINWEVAARDFGYENINKYRDPRNFFLKIVHFWLRKSQHSHTNIFVRTIDKILKIFFKI